MKFISEFISQYGFAIIHIFFLSIVSYVSFSIKKILKKHVDDKTKKEVIVTVCVAINKLYPNLNNDEKFNKIIFNCEQILKEKGIIISDLELRMYIVAHGCDHL